MTEPARSAPGPDAFAGKPLDVPATWLQRVLDATWIEPGPDDHPPLGPTADGADETWQAAFERACVPHPLRLRTAFLSAREAIGAASPRTPLVSYGPGGWLAVVAGSGGRVRGLFAEGPDRALETLGLASALGRSGPDDVMPWILVEPALLAPPEPKRDTRGFELAVEPLRRLTALMKPDRSDLWAVVLYAMLIGALSLATPIAVQQLVNTVAFGGLAQPVVVLALLLFGGLSFSALLTGLQAFVAEKIQRRVFVRVAMDLAERLPRVSVGAFDAKHGPEVVNRIFDVFTVQKTGAALLLEGTSVVLQTVVGLVVLSFYHPLMLGFSVLLVGGIAIVLVVFGRGAVETAIGESSTKYAMAGWMEELARHPAAFRNPGGRDYALERADRLASDYVRARRRHYRIVLRQLTGALGLQVLAGSALLALGGGLVVAGQLTLGQLVASELIITAIVAAVAKLGKQLESYYDLLAATDKLGVLFDLPLERADGGLLAEGSGPAALAVHDVSFAYGARRVFDGLSLRIEPGERVLLTSAVGGGKSTLLELLVGLRDPDAGFITLDDHDLRELRLSELRDQIVFVGDAEIFPGTILDNVRVARPGLSTAEVNDVLARVGVLDEVRALPDGVKTQLATDGAPLAGGLIAALMLARAIVTRPRVMLIDDALGQLESPARECALEALFAPDAPWTLVVTSDQADVRARCPRVVELAGGAAAARGVGE